MKRINLFLAALVFVISAGVLAAGPAKATVWSIDAVLNGGDSGFGFSSFHRPGADPRMGSGIGNDFSTTATGTYNDVSGDFNGSFSLMGGPSFTLAGNLDFSKPPASVLGTLVVTFGSNFDAFTAGVGETLGFVAGEVCCGPGADAPNSFVGFGIGQRMTLWGANGFILETPDDEPLGEFYCTSGNSDSNCSPRANLGMDLRIYFVRVPEPGTLGLLGLGLAALGMARRRSTR